MVEHIGIEMDGHAWLEKLRSWARELGFSQLGVADTDLQAAQMGLQAWLDAGWHGQMQFMKQQGPQRTNPQALLPQTQRVITVRMDYLPQATSEDWCAREQVRLAQAQEGVISIYARGRDYHKVMRTRLQLLCDRIDRALRLASPEHFVLKQRPFVDSAPVMEVALAVKSGLGWRGKHTLLLNREGGSAFFLGEIYTNLPLPLTAPLAGHCGRCRACMDVCPTGAIKAPYRLDARACISYLTIEHEGPIPEPFRRAMGNRIYGCDDCQLVCPWNKFARTSGLPDFDVRQDMTGALLLDLFAWDEARFLHQTQGSAIRRVGYERWSRNLIVAVGNALFAGAVQAASDRASRTFREAALAALAARRTHASESNQACIDWAMASASGRDR